MFENVNEVAVIVSAILAVAVGNVWYSPMLFGTHWIKSLGGNGSFVGDNDTKQLSLAVLKGVGTNIIIFFVLAKLIALHKDLEMESLYGFVGLLLVFLWAHLLTPVIWEKKQLPYFFVHAGYFTIVLLIGLGIITKWPW
jgi:hypothetical protein